MMWKLLKKFTLKSNDPFSQQIFFFSSLLTQFSTELESLAGVGDTANFGIDLKTINYRASITDTNTDTFYLKIPDN